MWMLLHGFAGSPKGWSRAVHDAELGEPPLTPTLGGHGHDWQSRPVESFEGEVARLASLVSTVARPRLLCGYSMGARVGLGLLAHQPSLFDAAVLIGVHPGLTEETDRAERRRVDAGRIRLLREEGLEAFVEAWEALPLFASQRALSRGALAEQREIRLAHDAEGLARALEALGLAEMPDYRAAMTSSEIPIVLLTGSLDTKFSKIAQALAGQSAHVDARVVEGVGHNVVLEAPKALAATLQRVEETVRR